MNSSYDSSYVQLNPDLNDSYDGETGEEIYVPSNYPFEIPRVYLDSSIDINAGTYFNCIIVVNDNMLTKYTPNSYIESLAEDEEGSVIWIDKRTAPKEDCWKGKYLNKFRDAQEYIIEEFNLDTLEKNVYRTKLESTSQMQLSDYFLLLDYIDPNIIKRLNLNKDTNPN